MNYVTIRIPAETRRLLRLIAAATGEQMIDVLHRLCAAEWQRVQPSATGRKADDDQSESEGKQGV